MGQYVQPECRTAELCGIFYAENMLQSGILRIAAGDMRDSAVHTVHVRRTALQQAKRFSPLRRISEMDRLQIA
ncbi:MAG TPA: hypothetical protein DCG49_02375 [Ruminococcus sp.]|nr:hypothetical protein [Ruminococcus sp.]